MLLSRFLLSPIALLPLSLATPTLAAPNPTPTHGLTPTQLTQLRNSGAPILLPNPLPRGFRIIDITASGPSRFGPQYSIRYKNSQNTCFTVEFTGGGIGGPAYDYSLPLRNPLLGPVALNFGKTVVSTPNPPTPALLNTRHPVLMTDWTKLPNTTKGFYSLQSIQYPQSPKACRQTLTPNEAVGIFRSIDSLIER